jgi:hypothetical protein
MRSNRIQFSASFSTSLKRRAAPRTLVKKAIAKNKKCDQENQRAALNKGRTLSYCAAL